MNAIITLASAAGMTCPKAYFTHDNETILPSGNEREGSPALREFSVLYVDGDRLVRDHAVRVLGRWMKRVYSAGSGQEALAAFFASDPDIVITDLALPGMNGFHLAEKLKSVKPDLPVLLTTCKVDADFLIRAIEVGINHYMHQPISERQLYEALSNSALALRQRQLELRLKEKLICEKMALEQAVADRTRELVETRLEIIRRLSRAAEFRDNETGRHLIRMSMYSATLARRVGLPGDQVQLILEAAPMHDVGKIGIPDSILLKPGCLDRSEWEIMKTHTTIGARILEGESSGLLGMATMLARSHHEKWNGTGYPDGLKGDAIPIEARMVAIGDVFDALTSRRPYREPGSIDDALAEIRNLREESFDPDLVEAFVECRPEIEAIMAAYQDD